MLTLSGYRVAHAGGLEKSSNKFNFFDVALSSFGTSVSKPSNALMTQVPKEINDALKNLNLVNLFASPPAWATL